MKRFFSLLLCLTLLIPLMYITAYAADPGDGNMNGGGGGMGAGTGTNFWHEGEDGVRLTVIKASDKSIVSKSIDLTNYNENDVQKHFGKHNKMEYKNGSSLVLGASSYSYSKPDTPMPRIISNGGNANIAAIKHYFCSEPNLIKIAQLIGADYNKLINGNYKLLIEPVAYFTFNGIKFAMTATEAAIYDQMANGALRSKMVSLTHQNLPLSLYLETADLGFPAYTGSKSKAQSDSTIIKSLGLGIVKFKPDGGDDDGGDPVPSAAQYRVNTDVVTSVTLSSDDEINPNSPASVTFHIMGSSYKVTNIVIPEGESQLVWCKWHTPSIPQSVSINVSASKGSLNISNISASIVSLDGKDPPDPQAKDRNDGFTSPSSLPSNPQQPGASWGIWSGTWIPNWVWHESWHWVSDSASPTGGQWVDRGKYVDEGYWQYKFTKYHATLSAAMTLSPDDKDWSAKGKQMKSGYGVKTSVSGNMAANAPTGHYTGVQTAVAYFPEFGYKNYWRHLELTQSGNSALLEFRNNIFSTYSRRVHFTPLWYPDGTYKAYTYLEDAWTPAGMLSSNLSDYVDICGSVYDDWHIGPKMVD